jgi:putative DNA primase/helicase
MQDKLLEERDGIFTWLIEGARRYLKEGLSDEPKCISALRDEYRDTNDVLGRFIADCLIEDKSGSFKARDAYEDYKTWCGPNGEAPTSEVFFASGLKERGIQKNASRLYVGYRLRSEGRKEQTAKPLFSVGNGEVDGWKRHTEEDNQRTLALVGARPRIPF